MKLIFASILMIAVLGSMAQAGAASSGGGEIITDEWNPWFVQNTAQVKYCIKNDPSAFHRKLPIIRTQLAKAFSYWKNEFSRAYVPNNGNPNSSPVYVGTQEVTEVSCSDSVDLTFQFGTLTGAQLAELGDVSKLIGFAMRTDYDEVNLRPRLCLYGLMRDHLNFRDAV